MLLIVDEFVFCWDYNVYFNIDRRGKVVRSIWDVYFENLEMLYEKIKKDFG